jgi:signal transduction histidine kinase
VASEPPAAVGNNASLSDAVLEQCPGCRWVVDGGFRFVRVFGDPLPLFGQAPAELAGQDATQVLESVWGSGWRERFRRVLAGESMMLRERLGATTWNVTLFPMQLTDGRAGAGGCAAEATLWMKAEQELRQTVLAAFNAQEYERNVISRFLHDTVGQNLTAFGLQLDLIRMDLESTAPDQGGRIAELQKLLEDMMESVRDYSYRLNPATVERAGLRSALDRLAGHIRERFAGTLRLNVDPSLKIAPRIASAMFRIAEHAVDNAVQHSGASVVEIAIRSTRSGSYLEVKDNGRGFDPSDMAGGSRGLGLLHMERYAAEAGLDLSVSSQPGKGTVIRAAEPGVG